VTIFRLLFVINEGDNQTKIGATLTEVGEHLSHSEPQEGLIDSLTNGGRLNPVLWRLDKVAQKVDVLPFIEKNFPPERNFPRTAHKGKYRFIGNCVNLDGESIQVMVSDAIPVTYRTLQRHCEKFGDIVQGLGYSRSFPIKKDWAVSYHKGTYRGQPCYFFRWSGFEYVWTQGE
jgi:hypothetical protein